MVERLQPSSPPLRQAWGLLITLQGPIVSAIKFTQCCLLDIRNLSKLRRRTGGGQKWKHPKHPTFFWLYKVSCAWPTALAQTHSIYVYFSLLPQALKAKQRLTACHKYVIWAPCWLAENIPGLMTVLKTWVLQIRDITGASAPRKAAVMLLQNAFEYFSILSYLHASKANPSLKSWHKCSAQILFGDHKGKKSPAEMDGCLAHNPATPSVKRHCQNKTRPTFSKWGTKQEHVLSQTQALKKEAQSGCWRIGLNGRAAERSLMGVWTGMADSTSTIPSSEIQRPRHRRPCWHVGELGCVCRSPLWVQCLMTWRVWASLPLFWWRLCFCISYGEAWSPLCSTHTLPWSQGFQVNMIWCICSEVLPKKKKKK